VGPKRNNPCSIPDLDAISRANFIHTIDGKRELVSITVGAHDFVSARPLIFGLTRRQAPEVELVYQEPAILAESLRHGRLNAALIPAIEFLRGVGTYFLDGPALVARPSAGSLLLVSRGPADCVERVAVGEHSRSPVAATRIVLAEKYGVTPDLCVFKNLRGDWREHYDGVLLTGDLGLQYLADRPDPELTVTNITALWEELTSLPLVLSLWAFDDKDLAGRITKIMVLSRNLGLQNLSLLADGISLTSPFNSEMVYDYLTNCWDYQLTADALQGLHKFEEFAIKYDLIRQGRLSGVTMV
jgi:chorismate dehydratase